MEVHIYLWKKEVKNMMGCPKCMKVGMWFWTILAVAFLGVDLNWWNFWGINWWTGVLVVLALGKMGHSNCKACQAMMKKRK